tara:strand:- start:604 stop:3705 length:3102 start_codon:yes stop_codon:yes gene_type:complete
MVRYYPRIQNDNFKTICQKKEFKKYKTIRKDRSKDEIENSLLLPHQQFIANYINPTTPYKGMLVYHETGTGKTCTAVSIAENFKEFVKENKNKIWILSSDNVKNEFRKTIKSTETKFKCTGNTYINQINRNELTNEKVDTKLNELVNKHYNFLTYQNFGNDLLKNLKAIKNSSYQKCKKYIYDNYTDIVLIVDEAHNLRSKPGINKIGDVLEEWYGKYINKTIDKKTKKLDDNKVSRDAIDIITKHAKNIRLIFLTATPMFDTPVEIIWLINMLIRVNEDNIDELVEDKMFDNKYNFINNESKELFERALRGKVSYLRSGDPLRFPLRIESKDMFTVSNVSDEHYNKIEDNFQLKDSFQTQITQIHNVSWHTNAEKTHSGLTKHFDIKLGSNPTIHEFRSKDNVLSNLNEMAPKVDKIVKLIEKMEDGIAFVFSKYVWSGIVPVMLALEHMGYSQYKENSTSKKNLLKNSKSEKTDKKYAIITSTPHLSFERQDKVIKAVRSKANANGQNIRVILASSAGGEGIDLKNIRQLHIIEPHYNFSLIEQVIGRAIRTDSHIDLEENKRNCSIFYHVSKYPNGELGLEKNIYDIAAQKKKGIQMVRKLLQTNSITCEFFKSNNEFELGHLRGKKIINSFGNEIAYEPVEHDDEYKTTCNFCSQISNDIDNDTYRPLMHSKSQVFIAIKWITELFENSPIYLIDDIIKIIQKRDSLFDIESILFAINTITNNRHHIIINNVGVRGMIYFEDPFLKFRPEHSLYSGRYEELPLEYTNPDVPLKDIPFGERPRLDIDNSSKVNKLIIKYLQGSNFSGDGFWDTDDMRSVRDKYLAMSIIDKISDVDRFELFKGNLNETPVYIQAAIKKYERDGGFLRISNTTDAYTITDKTGKKISSSIKKKGFPSSKELPLCGFINFEKEKFIFKVLDRRVSKGTGANLGSAGDATKKKLLDVLNTLTKYYCEYKNIEVFERYINNKETEPNPPMLNAGHKASTPTNNSIYIECEMFFRLLTDLKVKDKNWFIPSWETYEYDLPKSAKN